MLLFFFFISLPFMVNKRFSTGKVREGKTKQVKFKTLFKCSQRWGRGDVQW